MSLDQNPSELMVQGVSQGRQVAPGRRGLAKFAYRLACLGPLAFFVMAFFYPPNPRALPDLPARILWWTLCLCSPIGAVLGAVLLIQFYTSTLGSRRMGSVYAMAAVCVGTMASIALVVGTPVLPSMRHEFFMAHRTSCLSNLKQLNTALIMYVQDYDDHYPPANTWNDEVYTYTKNREVLICPELYGEEKRPTYAFNRSLQNVSCSTIASPEQTVTLFDSVPGNNLAGGRELFPDPSRHTGGEPVGFVDGHAKMIPPDGYSGLIWTPRLVTKSASPSSKAIQDILPDKAQPAK